MRNRDFKMGKEGGKRKKGKKKEEKERKRKKKKEKERKRKKKKEKERKRKKKKEKERKRKKKKEKGRKRKKKNILLSSKRRTRLFCMTPCFMGNPCLSLPPMILKTYPLYSSPRGSAATSEARRLSSKKTRSFFWSSNSTHF